MAAIKKIMNYCLILFQQLSTSKYTCISILASCIPQMQLALTTSLQLVVCARKLVTKQPLLTNSWPTKIINIFLKDSSAYCGTRGCTYFEGGVAFLTPIATVWVTKKFPFSVKQQSCNRNFAFHFRAHFVLHISVFIFAAWAKLFYVRATEKKR